MDSRRRSIDRLSSLSDNLLILIISILPFKEAIKTSVLSKRWTNLCHETTNISFKESDFVKRGDEETKRVARVSFVRYMVEWVSRFSCETIESFQLCISKPFAFEAEIKSLIEFAVSKQVKNLVLDFSDHSNWDNCGQAKAEASKFLLPECIYNATKLESLKLVACVFEASRISNTGSIKSLSFGWTQVRKIMSLLSKCPLLESLSLTNCWNVGLASISGSNNWLTELVLEDCKFVEKYTTLLVSNIETFKYTGEFHYFQFMKVNSMMKEAYLDFEAETKYNDETGTLLCGLLHDLKSAKTLDVGPFLTQVIQHSEDPVKLQAPIETRHLVIKTNLQESEFVGIRLMINSCPDLERLTFEMVSLSYVLPITSESDPDSYWTRSITHKCLNKTLKAVEVKGFRGSLREVQVMQYLIGRGKVLESVDFYMSSDLDDGQKMLARAASSFVEERVYKASGCLKITLHA
ncbi:unnamed protein product [Cochlearia groenlandica]